MKYLKIYEDYKIAQDIARSFQLYFPDMVSLIGNSRPGYNEGHFSVNEIALDFESVIVPEGQPGFPNPISFKSEVYRKYRNVCIYEISMVFPIKLTDVNPEINNLYRIDFVQDILDRRNMFQADGYDIYSMTLHPCAIGVYVYKISEFEFLNKLDKDRLVDLVGSFTQYCHYNEHLVISGLKYRTIKVEDDYRKFDFFTFEGPSQYKDIQDVIDWFTSGGELHLEHARKLKKKDIDIQDIKNIFTLLIDYGFEVDIAPHFPTKYHHLGIHPAPEHRDILSYCNGYVYVGSTMKVEMFTKKEKAKQMMSDINILLEEINDRIPDLGFICFNKIWTTSPHHFSNSTQLTLHIGYYLVKESGFKKGTKFQIPKPEFLDFKHGKFCAIT